MFATALLVTIISFPYQCNAYTGRTGDVRLLRLTTAFEPTVLCRPRVVWVPNSARSAIRPNLRSVFQL